MRLRLALVFAGLIAGTAQAQIQVDLKFKRLQYVAYEPIIATVRITNLSGRAIDLRDENGQRWFGFEVTAGEDRLLTPTNQPEEPALKMETGQTVTQKINLTPLFPVHDLGSYRVRANLFFADLNKFFYSQRKVIQVGDARPIWQRTVGVPEGGPGAGSLRTYSLLSNRFPDHTKLYVRVEDKSTGAVYSTYSLGRMIVYDDPEVELDRANQLHVLHCAAPRTWAYSRVGVNGELLAQSNYMETRSRPRLRHSADGAVTIKGGTLDAPVAESARNPAAKLSARPPATTRDE
ncbi:MAG: hypothetical protein ABR589_03610 [Chthoniobacterales bacterium]